MASVHERAAKHEPAPVPNQEASVQDMVIADLEARKRVGLERYGTLLQPFNGRDALMDLYQEILDAANYCRQELEEQQRTRESLRDLTESIKYLFPDEKSYRDYVGRLAEFVRAHTVPPR